MAMPQIQHTIRSAVFGRHPAERPPHPRVDLHRGDLLIYFDSTFNYLTSLKIQDPAPFAWSLLSKLLLGNNHLERLTLSGPSCPPPSAFWSSLAHCKNLKKLRLIDSTIDAEDISAFWTACMKLQVLRVQDLFISGSSEPVFFGKHLEVFPNMESLQLQLKNDSVEVSQVLVLLRCPKLREYHFNVAASRTISLPIVALILSKGYLPCLERLVVAPAHTEDPHLQLCIKDMCKLTQLFVPRSAFGLSSYMAMERHFPTLQNLNLHQCCNVTGDMVQRILESCPLLSWDLPQHGADRAGNAQRLLASGSGSSSTAMSKSSPIRLDQ